MALSKSDLPLKSMQDFLLILSPYAPHLAEELFARLGAQESLATMPWPEWDAGALETQSIEIAIQVQGKLRASVKVPKDISKDDLLAIAKENDRVQRHLEGMVIVKEIVVPGRLVNLVVRPQ